MINLNFKAPFRGMAGYCVAARNIVLELSRIEGLDVCMKQMEWVNKSYGGDNKNWPLVYDIIKKGQKFKPENASLLHMSIGREFMAREGHRRAYGYTFYETSSLPKNWVQSCNSMEVMIVPSRFNYETFRNAGVNSPLEIVPLGVDTDIYNSGYDRFVNIPEKFTFLSIMQVSQRKGCELVLKAFLECFSKNKDVQLIIRWYFTHAQNDETQVKEMIDSMRKKFNISQGNILLMPTIHETQMPRLYNSAHVLVAPFRGEAWGLPVIEALACELPVICTNWGGVTEYFDSNFGIPLDYKLVRVPEDAVMDAKEDHFWAEPDYKQLKSAMTEMYNNYIIYKAKAVAAREFLVSNFTWKHSAKALFEVLKKWD